LPNAGPGTWHALLGGQPKLFERLRATLSQSGLVPGSTMTVSATLEECGVPVDGCAIGTAEITDPVGSSTALGMTEVAHGRFQVSTIAVLGGVYPVRVVARGVTLSGTPFTREQTLTGVALHGGDEPLPTTPAQGHSELCCLVRNLTEQDSVLRYLKEQGIDPDGVRKKRSPAAAGASRAQPRHAM